MNAKQPATLFFALVISLAASGCGPGQLFGPTPTSTPTNTPTFTLTYTPTDTSTSTATFTPTNTPTNTATATPTNTLTPTDTATPTNTATPSNTATVTPSNTPSSTFTMTPSDTATVTPTLTPSATQTFDPNIYFNMTSAKVYKVPGDYIEMRVPSSWQITPLSQNNGFDAYLGNADQPTVAIQVGVDTVANLARTLLGTGKSATSLTDLVQQYRAFVTSNFVVGTTMTDLGPAKIGKRIGTGFVVTIPAATTHKGLSVDFRAVQLTGNLVAIVFATTDPTVADQAKTTVTAMLDSIVLNPAAVAKATVNPPTSTPTSASAARPTLDVNAFNMASAITFKAPDGSVEIRAPKGWKAKAVEPPAGFEVYIGDDTNPDVLVVVGIDTLTNVSHSLNSSATVLNTGAELLQQFHDFTVARNSPNTQVSLVVPAKIGKLVGTGFTIIVPAAQKGREFFIGLRIVQLAGDKVAYSLVQVNGVDSDQVKAATAAMLDSVLLNPAATP